MAFRYLDKDGALSFWTNIKNFILSKIPTKTSELTNDSGFLTQHQSLSNYVTLNSEQTITGKKLFTNSTTKVNSVNTFTGSTQFIDLSTTVPRGAWPAEDHRVGRVYIGDNTSYNGAWFIVDPTITSTKAYYRMVTTNPDNTDSTRFSIVWDSTKEGARCRKNVSQGDLLPSGNNTYNLGADDLKWDIGYIHNLIGSNKENASEDANNYYSSTSGSHMTFYTTTNGGTKLSNVPEAVNTHLESRTIRYLSSSDWIVEQICHNSFGLYYRKGDNNGWGNWKTFAFTDSNITGTASNVTGTVAIANGGTGATTRLNAIKNLTNESVGSPTHFLGLTTNYAKCGYTSIAQAKTVLGITGDIVTHNASEFLTSHQSLSSCVKNVVTNNQTIKSTGITRGTAPSSAQTFGIAFSDNNDKYIGNIYGQYATDKSTYVGLYAYKGTTTANSDNVSVRVGYDASGNAYTYAPTPATTDNSTQIATTAFVKAQGYLTSHQSLANYLTKTTNVSEMGRYIDLHYDNATSKYDYDARLYVDSQGTAAGGGSFKIAAASAYAPAPASNANDTRIATTAWVNSKGYLTSHPSITLSSNTTSTASPAHGGTFTCIDSVTQDTNGHITKVNTKTITLPADNNTDTKVTQTVTTANSGYPVLLCATVSATATETTTSRFSEGLTVNARYSAIYMTNKYDTANTKGVRNTSSYGNGYIVFRCYDASEMGRIHCESSKNGYQQTYMQARSYIKNGAISPEGTATTCYITVRVRDNGSKTIYTDGSWENSLTPYANNTHSLGTSSLQWKNAYAVNFYENGTALSDKYLTVSAISGGASTSAGNIIPVKGTIISGFADSSSVTYSTSFGAVLTSPSYLYYATGVFNSSNSTMEYFKGPSVGGTGTWKLMGGCVQNPGSNAKLLFGLWIKIV